MAGINKVILVGNLGDAPESRAMPSGEAVVNFTVATSEKWKDKQTGQPVEATEWHRVSAFGRLAEICAQYLQKGSKVYIEGKLHTRKWQDKTGADRYTTEIKAKELQMLDSRGTQSSDRPDHPSNQPRQQVQPATQQYNQQSQSAPASQAGYASAPSQEFDDVPF